MLLCLEVCRMPLCSPNVTQPKSHLTLTTENNFYYYFTNEQIATLIAWDQPKVTAGKHQDRERTGLHAPSW